MDPLGGSVPVPADIEEALCHDPDIEFVVAFGSRATGTPRPSSDLDIAVKFSESLSSEERFRKRCHLSGHLQASDAPFVDLSDIKDLSVEFAHAAVNGELVCGDDEAFQEFKQSIEDEFVATQGERENDHREFIRRVAEEGLRG